MTQEIHYMLKLMWEDTSVLNVRIGKPATQPGKLTVLIMKVSKGSYSMIQWKSVTQSGKLTVLIMKVSKGSNYMIQWKSVTQSWREVTPLCNVKSVVTQPGKLTVLLLIVRDVFS